MAKKNKTLTREEELYKKLSIETRRQLKANNPQSLAPLDNEVKIMIPVSFSSMGGDLSSIQIDVIREMFYYLRQALIKQLDPNYKGFNSLFTATDFSEDGKSIVLPMKLKEFHVDPYRYPELRSALTILASIPVQIPFVDGKNRKFKKIQGFCHVYIPDKEEKKIRDYCVITIEKEIAEKFISLDLGYGIVGRIASQHLDSKYSKRIYNLLSTYKNLGGYTINMKEFRRICAIENRYVNKWAKVEENVLLRAKEEMDENFSRGELELSFTYRPLYNNGQNNGEPDAIEFKIFTAKSELDRKIVIMEKGYREQLEKFLKDELKLSPSLCRMFMKRVTLENVKAAISTAINVKTQIESGNVKQEAQYIISSFNNFFETFTPLTEETDNMTPQAKWNKIQESIGKGQSHNIQDIFSQLLFKSYDKEKKEIMILVPSHDFAVQNFPNEGSECKSILRAKVNDFFGKDIKIQLKVKED